MARWGPTRVPLCVIACLTSAFLVSCGDHSSPPVEMLIDGPRQAGTWQHSSHYEQNEGAVASRRWLQGGDDFTEIVHSYWSTSAAAAAFTNDPPERDEVYEGAKEYMIGARMKSADQVDYKCGTWNEQSRCVTWWAWARYGRYTVALTYRRPMRGTSGLTDLQLATVITNAGADLARQTRRGPETCPASGPLMMPLASHAGTLEATGQLDVVASYH